MHKQAGAVTEEPRENEGQLQKHQHRSKTPTTLTGHDSVALGYLGYQKL